MSNLLELAGVQKDKPTKFSAIYTGRFSSGIWTNRSPLRDATTTRIVEKFYGQAGDALIAGSNVEITNKLTLARRPGNITFDNNTWDSINSFYSFHAFQGYAGQAPTDHVNVIIDEPNILSALVVGQGSQAVWDKSSGAGQTYSQSVGNSLYFGNRVDNKKWLHEIYLWEPNEDWTGASTPLLRTFVEDNNNNLQQLIVQGISGGTLPTWSTVVPDIANNFLGGTTVDGTAQWVNRGPRVENWGIVAPTGTPITSIEGGGVAWQANTVYSQVGVVIDSNGNLQQLTTAGKSGATVPTWATIVGNATADGSNVWTMLQTAASLIWQPHTVYAGGAYVIGNGCLFHFPVGGSLASVNGTVTAYLWNSLTNNGSFSRIYPLSSGTAAASATNNSFTFPVGNSGAGASIVWDTLNGAGEITGTTIPFPSYHNNYDLAIVGSINVPNAGTWDCQLNSHHDGAILGIGDGATKVSGLLNDPYHHAQSAVMGYSIIGGSNVANAGQTTTDAFQVNFPTAGVYHIEIDFAYGSNNPMPGVKFYFQGNNVAPAPLESGTIQPVWPGWTLAFAPSYPYIDESIVHQFRWYNFGPIADFQWIAGVNYKLAGTGIIDPTGSTEYAYRTGLTGSVAPTFATGLYQLTPDNPNLIWVNYGIVLAPPNGSVSTFNGGWKYCICLVNTLDQTVSNAGTISIATGNFIGAPGITLPPGSGLDPTKIDPQADYVAIFRTTDGGAVPFLIPGFISEGSPATQIAVPWTVPLHTYLTTGYIDTTPDTSLNNLISAPVLGENTPPGVGAINLTYHLNRIFFSIANVVYWTSGPDTPAGNGINGVAPLNYSTMPATITRIVPTAIGALIFTVDSTWIIQGTGTAANPLQGGITLPYLSNLGLLSYNALDLDGSLIGLFTTDNQFLILDPSAGTVDAGFPLGNLFRLNNGLPGESWDASKVYVACHTQGEDHAFYISDGTNGWYRLMPTPSPEIGYTWSPFASINQEGSISPLINTGCKCVQSIEVTPGAHRLLIGPVTSGPILNRDLTVFTDGGIPYPANATIGSAVLAQPGQQALVMFIATDSVRIGTPLTLGILLDEALPYYKGPIEVLKEWESDPINIEPASISLLGQRFYLDELHEKAAIVRHMQVQILWSPTDSIQNELLSLSIFGGFVAES
jgi:hypothetical protein